MARSTTRSARLHLSTGQAAKRLSVTPDTILKWIKRGRLQAVRTAGGHCRIAADDLDSLQQPERRDADRVDGAPGSVVRRLAGDLPGATLRCWDYYARDGELRAGCRRCLVYKAQAERCFEMSRLPRENGFEGLFCEESCDRCQYYRKHVASPLNILVITSRDELKVLADGRENSAIRIRLATCEYECSYVVDTFRPDFVIIDCASLVERATELCEHLAADPRIPDVKVIAILPSGATTPDVELPAGVIGLSLGRGASVDQVAACLKLIEAKIGSIQAATLPPRGQSPGEGVTWL